MTTLLEVKGLDVSYGHIAAVKGIDFALKAVANQGKSK